MLGSDWRILHAAKAFQAMVWSFAVPFRISRIANDREAEYSTGTGTLLDLNGRYHVLTAWHVYEKYLDWVGEGEEAIILVDDAPLVVPVITFQDEANDIVLLEVPNALRPNVKAEAYKPGSRWPPRRVEVGDLVLFCGFPAYFRREPEGGGEILFADYSISQEVTSVSEHQFILQLDRENWVNAGRVPIPGPDVFLGGISGGPVFALDQFSGTLVGLVKSIGENLPLLYAASLNQLPADI